MSPGDTTSHVNEGPQEKFTRQPINRLKMLKRQMCGRARLDLLSRRFVRAPREGQPQAPGHRAPVPAHAAAQAA
jgi:hypothetical protein